jgi:hypothetical protein
MAQLATQNHRGRVQFSGLAATGVDQGSALKLAGRVDSIQEINTAAAGTGVMLPPPILPMRCEIINQGANAITVYPQAGGTIDNGSLNAGVALPAGKAIIYEASSLSNWYSVGSTASAGGAISAGTAGQFAYYAAAGSTISGTSAIKVGSGGQVNFAEIAAPASPVAGDQWNDNVQHCGVCYDGAATAAGCLKIFRPGLIFNQVTQVQISASGSVQTYSLISTAGAVGTVALPAGFLNVVGRKVRIRAGGYMTTPATTGSFVWSIKLGSGVVLSTNSFNPTASLTNIAWRMDVDFTVLSTGSSGTLGGSGVLMYPSSVSQMTNAYLTVATSIGGVGITNPTVDFTSALTLDFQITFTQSGNIFTLTNLSVEVLA